MLAFKSVSCKAAGLACMAFCVGITAGLVLPVCAVAVIEAAMILFVGYLCLFTW